MSEVHLFGIRHHGPGSARSLVRALTALKPDIVLIEGPPDADELLGLASDPQIEPPIALLIYASDSPRDAVLYPFADYSPEWQAIQFALRNKIPVRFIDLPQAQRLARPPREIEAEEKNAQKENSELLAQDPLQPLAAAAGYSDAERWWDDLVEARSGDDTQVFAAVHEMMCAAREALVEAPRRDAELEAQREAYMRTCIRESRAGGHARIAVVCGAYHTPGLSDLENEKADRLLLKNLPKTKTQAAWVPWSYERLSFHSGYGAGVESPLWYELLWNRSTALGAQWLTRAARLLRDEDLPISSAHVIEACRLADSLASLRSRPLPGLPEYNDAALSVLVNGDAMPLELIAQRWHCGDRLGKIPEHFPASPLQTDLAAQQKRLRMPPKAEDKTYDLDLREATDRERSHLLRRLRLLGIEWGTPAHAGGSQKGTFHEVWQVRWQPDFAVALIAGSRFGHTIAQAAATAIVEQAATAKSLQELVGLLENGLFADLPDAIPVLVTAIENQTATAADIAQLLDALPPLVSVRRYGNVRSTNVSLVDEILRGAIPRILIALPSACANLDDDAAREMWKRLQAAQQALTVLAEQSYLDDWHATLARMANNSALARLLCGYATRIIYDARKLDRQQLDQQLSLELSVGNDPLAASAWIEGFLAGSGALLVHDNALRDALDTWLRGVSADHFTQALPLLRRTFSQFPFPERRAIGEQLRRSGSVTPAVETSQRLEYDETSAAAMHALLKRIWTS